MTPQHLVHDAARSTSTAPSARISATKRSAYATCVRVGTLYALFGLAGSVLVSPAVASATPARVGPFAAGSVVVAQGGTIAGNGNGKTGIEANGGVDVYPPNSNGDVAPEASFTKGMYGPFVVIFDPSGDLWAANVDNGTLVEITKAQLGMADPMPAVTISSASGALDDPYGMAFDPWGNLWVVGNKSKRVYEYTKSQLAGSGSPTPHSTISEFPGTPLGDGFDPSGDLWVTVQLSHNCPRGCLVEFSKAELAMAGPMPTVTISSTGGANIAFTPSGDMWMVTGGGPKDNCYGTPCNNELVEFTKAQLSKSGSPTPAVTISSTRPGAAGALWGPYGVAVDPSGDVWVSNFNKPTTVEFGKAQLSKSGALIPQRTIVGAKTGMNWPSFVVTVP